MIEFVEDLKRWRAGLPIMARSATKFEKIWLWMKRYPLAVLLLLTFLVSGVTFVVNYKKRGELLHESLVERARAERLVKEPGFRGHVLKLLSSARDLENSSQIREEVVAALAYWDVTQRNDAAVKWRGVENSKRYKVEEGSDTLRLGITGKKPIPLSGVLRCSPALSADGRFLAIVSGDRIEVKIYDLVRQDVFITIPLESWPKKIEFSDSEEVIKVVFENEKACLLNLRGGVLLEGFRENDFLTKPVGLTKWKGNFLNPSEANPYSGVISENEMFFVTMSVIGVQIWNTELRAAADFYEVDNQRIDAPTEAWWLDNHRLLIQIPGAQEVVEIDETGLVINSYENQRIPGSRVIKVLPNGDWQVEVKNEDGESQKQLWIGGDPEQSKEYVKLLSKEELSFEGGLVHFEKWKLALPKGDEVLEAFVLQNGERVIALTTNYEIYEWDLPALESALKSLEF